MTVDGTWYSGMGSELRLSTDGDIIYGSYVTSVGSAVGEYKLTGRLNNDPAKGGMAVGFVVIWNNGYINSHCVTSWSGQYQVHDDQEELVTTWLLTQVTADANDWHSTLIGHDVFLRQPPSAEQIKKRAKHGPVAHPMS